MDLRVDFFGGSLEFSADPNVVLAAWTGPTESVGNLNERIAAALDSPLDFPPVKQVVVPGDRVVIAFDGRLAGFPELLEQLSQRLWEVEVASITVVVDDRAFPEIPIALPQGVTLVRHDPTDRDTLAYLATTESGRRVYLNKLLADADCVIPIGLVTFNDEGRVNGPWSVIEPGLSDAIEPLVPILALTARRKAVEPGETNPTTEVSWLLGCHFQIAVLMGSDGISDVIAGESAAVAGEAEKRQRTAWLVTSEARADLVIAGVGGKNRQAGPREFVQALRQALAAVDRGGKIALLCDFNLPSLREALSPAYLLAEDFDRALTWADIYLHARASADDIEELGMIGLERAGQAGKLATPSHSLITLNQADRTWVSVKS